MAVRRALGVIVCWFLFGASIAIAQPVDADAPGPQVTDQEEITIMLARINAMRAAQSLPPFTRDATLDAVAQAHSEDMAEHAMIDHVSPRTGNPLDRVTRAGFAARRVAENVAQHTTVLGAHLGFIQSEAHRNNLLRPDLTHIGVGIVRRENKLYITQVFATPQDATAAPPDAPAETPLPAEVPAATAAPVTIEPTPPASPPSAPTAVAAPEPQVPSPSTSSAPRRVAGYWIRANGRWWYYPLPADARPGQVLQPDLTVQGGPRAYGGNAPQVAPSPPNTPPPSSAPVFGWSPRRHYRNWISTP